MLQRIARSEAGQKIWEAGERYQKISPDPELKLAKQKQARIEVAPKLLPIQEIGPGLTLDEIVDRAIEAVDDGVSVDDVFIGPATPRNVAVRHAVYWACHTFTSNSYAKIGRYFGRTGPAIAYGVTAYANRHGLQVRSAAPRQNRRKKLTRLRKIRLDAARFNGMQEMQRIIKEVAEEAGISAEAIVSRRRDRDAALARHEAMYRCVAETERSLPEIARKFKRDHTTIGHAVVRFARRWNRPFPRGMSQYAYAHKTR